MTMDIQTVKLDLIQWLAGLQDPAKVFKILDARKEIEANGYEASLKPMTREELVARAIASNEAIEKGEVTDWEDMMKEKW